MAKSKGFTSGRVPSSKYVPGRPYRGDPRARRPNAPVRRGDTGNFGNPGGYSSPPIGPGPGRGPYPWREPPPVHAVDFTGSGWEDAAASSTHTSQLRFLYALDYGVLDLHDGRNWIEEDNSVLQVRFKPSGWAVFWSVPGTSYTAERLEAIYHMMLSADHPWEIGWSHLIGVGGIVKWPYDTSAS